MGNLHHVAGGWRDLIVAGMARLTPPEELERLARVLDREAEHLDQVRDELRRTVDATHGAWEGLVADRFRGTPAGRTASTIWPYPGTGCGRRPDWPGSRRRSSASTSPTRPAVRGHRSAEMTLLLTVDELRALHRVTGAWLPRFVAEEDEAEPLVDLAALRGLGVRDLVELPRGDTNQPLTAHLDPYRGPRLVVEIEAEEADTVTHHGLSSATGATGLATERPGGLVELSLVDRAAADVIADLCHLGDVVPQPAGAAGFEVDAWAHTEADELALGGDADGAAAHLVHCGVPPPRAAAWITALTGRRRAVAVSVACLAGEAPDPAAGPISGGELRWLVGADGTAWRAGLREAQAAGGSRDAAAAVSVLRPTDGARLRRELDNLLAPVVGGGMRWPVS
jgi:hypothetical protein